jgi:hypothetical protein
MQPLPTHIESLRASAIDLAYITSLLVEAAALQRDRTAERRSGPDDVERMIDRTVAESVTYAISATERALAKFRRIAEDAECVDEETEESNVEAQPALWDAGL